MAGTNATQAKPKKRPPALGPKRWLIDRPMTGPKMKPVLLVCVNIHTYMHKYIHVYKHTRTHRHTQRHKTQRGPEWSLFCCLLVCVSQIFQGHTNNAIYVARSCVCVRERERERERESPLDVRYTTSHCGDSKHCHHAVRPGFFLFLVNKLSPRCWRSFSYSVFQNIN